MPEGHVLHRMARDLGALVGHAVAASSPQGRFADGAALIDGARLDWRRPRRTASTCWSASRGGRTVHVHRPVTSWTLGGRTMYAPDG